MSNQEINAQLLAALKGLFEDITGLMGESDGVYGLHLNGDVSPWGELDEGGEFERLSHLSVAQAAIAAAEAEQQPPAKSTVKDSLTADQQAESKYLLKGYRFKVSYRPDTRYCIEGLPAELNGQWVALVDATDNRHMQQPPAVPNEMTGRSSDPFKLAFSDGWNACRDAMLAAVKDQP